ncbi:hypothetical protein BaRGS_00032640 [Batillaria attramentaria]|uniref:Uncharacterized protein n=1 Tax=Batillaria attramentaria TaxID=370345 RepID=A0ABD0JNW3_9CAEN
MRHRGKKPQSTKQPGCHYSTIESYAIQSLRLKMTLNPPPASDSVHNTPTQIAWADRPHELRLIPSIARTKWPKGKSDVRKLCKNSPRMSLLLAGFTWSLLPGGEATNL